MQANLGEKLEKSEELRSTFRHFLAEVAKATESSKLENLITCSAVAQATKARRSSVQANLEEKLKKSEELRSTFRHFLTEVAKAAENSKTGRPIPHKTLSDYTKQESIKDAELQKVRLRHLMLKAQLAKIEHRVKQKVRVLLLKHTRVQTYRLRR